MVIGHFLYHSNLPTLNKAIYSFHVPLFFILAGYLQKPIEKHFISKRIRRLVFPYLAFSLIGLPVFGYSILRNGGTILDVVVDSLYLKGNVSNNPLWFLAVLFEISVLLWLARIPNWKTSAQVVAFIAAFFLSFFL